MDYRERQPAPELAGLVKAFWTLDAAGEGWLSHQATPDGCVELIRRIAGASRWETLQPEAFVVGLSERPVGFEISGDSRFSAVRFWPWAWRLLSDIPLDEMRNRWVPAKGEALGRLGAALPDFDRVEALLLDMIGEPGRDLARVGEAIVAAQSVAAMGAGAGLAPRSLQRWFAVHVGLPPRRYLRLLRFQNAFAEVPGQPSLASHAADHGFADQAHMAREFRSMAGVPAKRARRSAKGPFLR